MYCPCLESNPGRLASSQSVYRIIQADGHMEIERTERTSKPLTDLNCSKTNHEFETRLAHAKSLRHSSSALCCRAVEVGPSDEGLP
jgi:hypothetical protein